MAASYFYTECMQGQLSLSYPRWASWYDACPALLRYGILWPAVAMLGRQTFPPLFRVRQEGSVLILSRRRSRMAQRLSPAQLPAACPHLPLLTRQATLSGRLTFWRPSSSLKSLDFPPKFHRIQQRGPKVRMSCQLPLLVMPAPTTTRDDGQTFKPKV
jgi:hypothetical protein